MIGRVVDKSGPTAAELVAQYRAASDEELRQLVSEGPLAFSELAWGLLVTEVQQRALPDLGRLPTTRSREDPIQMKRATWVSGLAVLGGVIGVIATGLVLIWAFWFLGVPDWVLAFLGVPGWVLAFLEVPGVAWKIPLILTALFTGGVAVWLFDYGPGWHLLHSAAMAFSVSFAAFLVVLVLGGLKFLVVALILSLTRF